MADDVYNDDVWMNAGTKITHTFIDRGAAIRNISKGRMQCFLVSYLNTQTLKLVLLYPSSIGGYIVVIPAKFNCVWKLKPWTAI
jgi:hypothetical protein